MGRAYNIGKQYLGFNLPEDVIDKITHLILTEFERTQDDVRVEYPLGHTHIISRVLLRVMLEDYIRG